MNKDLRLSRVLPIVILAIIVILASLYIPQLSLLLLFIPVPFALIGTLSNIKNNIIVLIITFIAWKLGTKLNKDLENYENKKNKEE